MEAAPAFLRSGLVGTCLPTLCTVGWQGEKVKPVRTRLEARGPVLGILLTLWFQRYFRKKRSLQKNILKKYEPVTRYLSVSILILSVEGKFDDSTVTLSCSNHGSFAESFSFP